MISSAKGYGFQEERLSAVLGPMKSILAENHAETGVYPLPFNPDYERYLCLDSCGDLKVFTVRDEGGHLAGFSIFFIDTEIQQKDVRSATQSVNYVCRGHRGVGYSFMQFCDDILKKHGVNSIWRQATVKHDVSKIYERMGYSLVEKTYLRRL